MRLKYQHPANEADFELLCLRLMQAEKANSQLQLHGRRGENQHGRDIIDPSCRLPLWAAQCKLREHGKAISRAEIEDEVSRAKTNFPTNLQSFSILTTSKRSSQAQKTVAEINQRHQQTGLFAVELLTWDDIEVLLDKYDEVANEIYDSVGSRSLRQLKTDISTILERLPRPTANHPDDDKEQSAERRWQYIQSHPIRGVEILLILKGAVGFDWFRELLDDTRLTFSRDEKSFKLGQLLAASPAPNTKERSRALEQPVCCFWELYEPESGYWFKKITPTARKFSVVAGFDAVAPWSVLGVQRVTKLEDLALLTDIGVSIPARAYQVGVEEFEIRFLGDTFSFSVQLSEHSLDALHEFARTQHMLVKNEEPMPLGTNFSGVQLLDMFLRQLLPRPKNEKPKRETGIAGTYGPGGIAISFYPVMPKGFMKTEVSKAYVFKVTMPAKFDSAARIRELEKKLISNPADAAVYFELASGYAYEGRMMDVIRCLETAIKKAKPSANVHALMGQTLRKLGRFDEALPHCQKALVLVPDDARIHAELGICRAELGEHGAALAHFEKAAHIEPSHPGYQFNLCTTLLHLNRLIDAIVPAQRAADLAPNDFRNALRLGMLLDKDDTREKAEHYLEKATQLAPHSAEAHQQLGNHFALIDQHEKAVASFQRAIEIEETARRCELLGASFADLGCWPEAEAAFRRAVKLEPNDSGMLMNLGVIVGNLGRYAEAVELFEQLLRVDPNNVTAKTNLPWLRKQMANG